MSNFTVEITAPALVEVLNRLAAALGGPVVSVSSPAETVFADTDSAETPAPEKKPRASRKKAEPENPTPAPAITPANGTPQTVPSPINIPVPAQTLVPPAGQMTPAPTPAPAIPTALPNIPAPGATVAPTAAPVYTAEYLAKAATTLVDAERTPELLALLSEFGVQSMMQLSPDSYGMFALGLRKLGVNV